MLVVTPQGFPHRCGTYRHIFTGHTVHYVVPYKTDEAGKNKNTRK